jgi:ubiquinone/menaquinone biosynthesis C-methylase UbiE
MRNQRQDPGDGLEAVRDAYSDRALEYAAMFGSIESAADQDRQLVASWAQAIDGKIIDVGCGPGQWTNHLRELGADVEGIDPVAAFVDEAARRYPKTSFRLGRAESIDADDGSVGGILAWFSLIHSRPDQVGAILAEFVRCLRPNGGLLIGFFEGPALEPFDHAVTTAYFWPVDTLGAVIAAAGFEVVEIHARSDPGVRAQGTLIAMRRPSTW